MFFLLRCTNVTYPSYHSKGDITEPEMNDQYCQSGVVTGGHAQTVADLLVP